MQYAITSKGDAKSEAIKARMKQYLQEFDLVYDETTPEIVISVGGDGTFLEAFHRYKHRLKETAFIGIHTGHLGFYADWLPDEVEKLIIAIAKKPFEIVEYPLLDIKIHPEEDEDYQQFLALNEASIKSAEGTVVMDVLIKGAHFERFRGDGLCISTPSGSTAYNKALGGAIIHPSLNALQLTEMASINNRVFRTIGSPLILPNHHVCELKPLYHDRSFLITIDHETTTYDHIKSIECRVSDEKIRFARFRAFPFWKRVHDSFISDERG
ncbi:inorganic polyphosphate/ATP-NAD kinase [Gracilibacillus halophilus YIM-C55.5]|uniref:NAD kinase n=1 Tax=Gracilibacillus halophilus YIM-C55.5 TaxID=1308866 RepID=N4WA92_9BACI|nr:NAD kinase [Gracilibacillus halophilus]ENH96189.1 inorganic polyphosphate/ATP-NAD kinase [Gracilibacillus halophilus YIM-C55.5]